MVCIINPKIMKDVLVSLKSALLIKIVYNIKSLKSMPMHIEQRKHLENSRYGRINKTQN